MGCRPLPARKLALFCVSAVLGAAYAAAQDGSDRPPWARKSKTKSTATSTPSSTPDKSYPEPVNKDGTGTNTSAETDDPAQRSRIRVSVNLVNVLVSVVDDNNRPAPDLPAEAFKIFEEGIEQKIEV